jgi:hypothetical protein
MKQRPWIPLFSTVVAFLLSGCAATDPPPVQLDIGALRPEVNYEGLQEVLDASVTDDGQLVPIGVGDTRDALESQLKLLAVTGPTATPELFADASDRLAYWYNARAAWAIYLGLLYDFEDVDAAIMRRRFPLDGRGMTLARIDAELERFDDFRVVVAAPGVARQRARLPETVFVPEEVRRRVDERFNQFVADEERFVIDVARREIRVPPVLWQYRGRILESFKRRYGYEAPLRIALLWRVEGRAYRRLAEAVGYRSVGDRSPLCLAELFQ